MDDFQHRDILDQLNSKLSVKEKLISAHTTICSFFPFIESITVSIHDRETGYLKSYLCTERRNGPPAHHEVKLEELPSLLKIMKARSPNIVSFKDNEIRKEFISVIGSTAHGCEVGYAMPMFNNGAFLGFILFNARRRELFKESVLSQLDVFGHLIALMVITELQNIDVMSAALRTTTQLTNARDPETGSHLDRMSRYSRCIAQSLADRYHLDDDYIEHIFKFAPLHDIGKVTIPDRILLKPGRLSKVEMAIMRTHARKGRELIDEMIYNFQLDGMDHINILRNIAEYHHEAIDGSGYPDGKRGDQVPLEARIVAVADVFDALTSRRAYKPAWSNEDAFKMLERMAGEQLDIECVEALKANSQRIFEIQEQFKEDFMG